MKGTTIKKIVSYWLTSILAASMSSILFFWSSSADIIDTVFSPSINRDAVINLGQDKDAVWAAVFEWWVDVVIGGWWVNTESWDSLLITITKTLLRLTLILWITMTIRNAIKFVLAAGDGAKQKSAIKNISSIALGIVLALWSVAIIYLLSSLSKSLL